MPIFFVPKPSSCHAGIILHLEIFFPIVILDYVWQDWLGESFCLLVIVLVDFRLISARDTALFSSVVRWGLSIGTIALSNSKVSESGHNTELPDCIPFDSSLVLLWFSCTYFIYHLSNTSHVSILHHLEVCLFLRKLTWRILLLPGCCCCSLWMFSSSDTILNNLYLGATLVHCSEHMSFITNWQPFTFMVVCFSHFVFKCPVVSQ